LTIVIPVTLLLGFVSCSDEESPVVPEQLDVNSYLQKLPTWNEFSPPKADDDYIGDPTNGID